MTFELLTTGGTVGTLETITGFLPLILVFVFGYFFLIRPQKKKEKEAQQMRSSIEVGDEIVTIGGIIGTVVSVREDTLVVETGGDRSKLRLARWSIQQNNTVHDSTATK